MRLSLRPTCTLFTPFGSIRAIVSVSRVPRRDTALYHGSRGNSSEFTVPDSALATLRLSLEQHILAYVSLCLAT